MKLEVINLKIHGVPSWFWLLTMCVFSCGVRTKDSIPVNVESLPNERFTYISLDTSAFYMWRFSGCQARDTIFINEEDVLKSEIIKILQNARERRGYNEEDSLLRFSNYYYQLIPYWDSTGQPWTYVNAVCKGVKLWNRWESELTESMGGGDCSFEGKCNIRTRNSDFSIN